MSYPGAQGRTVVIISLVEDDIRFSSMVWGFHIFAIEGITYHHQLAKSLSQNIDWNLYPFLKRGRNIYFYQMVLMHDYSFI